jgi:hypothetical protein
MCPVSLCASAKTYASRCESIRTVTLTTSLFDLKAPKIDRTRVLPVLEMETPTCIGWRFLRRILGGPGLYRMMLPEPRHH